MKYLIYKTKTILRSRSGATLMVVLALMTLLLAIAGSALAAAAGASGISYDYIADQKLLISAESAKRTLDELIVSDDNDLGDALCAGVVNGTYTEASAPLSLDMQLSGTDTGIDSITLSFSDIKSTVFQEASPAVVSLDPSVPDIPAVNKAERVSFRAAVDITASDGGRTVTKTVVYQCRDVEVAFDENDHPISHTDGKWSIISYE